MKKYFVLFISLLNLIQFVFSQEKKEESTFQLKWSGYIKNDVFFDSRQTVSAREGHLLLWPKAPELDPNGVDINAHSNFNILAIQTRLKLLATGPEALGAKTSGMIEGEFFGHTDNDVNGFRLRHATINLDWEKSHLMFGQFWHPMFILECYPGTVSFNTGMGFAPFSRNPLVKYFFTPGKFKIAFTAYSERDFTSKDINGISSPEYLRNSKTPGLNLHLDYTHKNKEKESSSLSTGFAANWHTMVPEIKTANGYSTNNEVQSLSGQVYLNIKINPINFKIAAVYVQNSSGMMMPGGYAVHSIVDNTTLEKIYTPTTNAAGWIDISSTSKKWQPGIFAGYNQNLGTLKQITGKPGGFGTNIAYLYRISPRLNFYSGKIQFSGEIEITAAAFGDGTYNEKGIPQNPKLTTNYRFLFGTYYHF